MKQLFISLAGHNASGKSTLADTLGKEFPLSRVNGDDFRHFIQEHIRYFQGLDISYPSEQNKQLNPLVVRYRLDLARILLAAHQNVIFDVSSSRRSDRKQVTDLLQAFPQVTHVMIFADLPEAELLKRLEARGGRWKDMYYDFRKSSFEAPEADEADVVLRYDQHNFSEIRQRLYELRGQ